MNTTQLAQDMETLVIALAEALGVSDPKKYKKIQQVVWDAGKIGNDHLANLQR